MKLRRTWLALPLLILAAETLQAQNEIDAYRYNSSGVTGTARAVGVGGAFSAVGADFSATSLNPAGLALYRRSDIMFTPRLRITNTEASYLDQTESSSRSRFGFANVGYVGAARVTKWDRETLSRKEAESGLKSYAFGIGFNQLANFTRQTHIEAYNTQNSITDYFALLASGSSSGTIAAEPGLAGAAWQAGLIDTSGVDGNYVPAALGGYMLQDITILETGRVNEWNISMAGNIDDKIYGGLSVGIHDLRYGQELYHEESDINNVHQTWANDSTPLAGLSYTDIYDTRGTGVNLRVGVIFRPVDYFRAGISFQSPTWVSMSDDYIYEVTGNFDQDPTNYGREAESGTFSYTMTTPFKVTLGAMGMLKKLGFVSADFEYTDYTTTEYNSSAGSASGFYSFQSENATMRELFDAAYNFRLGTELRAGTGRFRLGYAMYGAILKDDYLQYIDFITQETEKLMGTRHFITGGVGIKQESFYLDLAYSREMSADRRLYYTVQDLTAYSPELIRRTTSGNFYMTIGFTF